MNELKEMYLENVKTILEWEKDGTAQTFIDQMKELNERILERIAEWGCN